jgi:hypothetical protein
MTDQLESDLRSLLARRAAAIHPDAAGGEQAVARRLEAGDTAVAEVISLEPPRRRAWLVAAAVLVIAAVGAGTFAATRGDDPDVQTGPVATAPVGRAAILEFRPVMAMGPCAEMGSSAYDVPGAEGTCYALGDVLLGNPLLRAAGVFASFGGIGEAIDGGQTSTSLPEETYGVTLTFTSDGIEQVNALASQCFAREPRCPTGQLAIVVDGEVLSAPTIQQPEFGTDQIDVSGDFTESEAEELAAALQPRPGTGTVTTTTAPGPPTAGDPTVGAALDSPKDVAERVAQQVFGEQYVTMAAQDDGSLTFVTLEGPRGSVVAEVVFDEAAGANRLLRMGPADSSEHPGAVTPSGGLSFTPPDSGELSYVTFDAELEELSSGVVVGVRPGAPTNLGEITVDTRWVAVRLETDDGRVLRWLDSVGGD